MPNLSIIFIRTGLIYFIFGFILGAFLLFNKAYPFNLILWQLLPLHYLILFFGWILQLVFGVAFWIMPRFGKSYGKTWLAWSCYLFLNTGLVTLISSYFLIFLNEEIKSLYILATILIYLGISCFVFFIWPRIRQVIAEIPPNNFAGE